MLPLYFGTKENIKSFKIHRCAWILHEDMNWLKVRYFDYYPIRKEKKKIKIWTYLYVT